MTILQRTPFLFNARGSVLGAHAARSRSISGGLTIGIRREDPGRIWERRCPLTPDAVQKLVKEEGVNVLVQPCERRVFTMRELTEVRDLTPTRGHV